MGRITPLVVCSLFVALSARGAFVSKYPAAPLRFEKNDGQTDARVRFLCRGGTSTIFLTSSEAVVSATDAVMRLQFLGANEADLSGETPLESKSNYFIGNDAGQWRTGVANFGAVRYRGVYRGIDLLFHGSQGRLEYDWIVGPGADPRTIRMRVTGGKRTRIDAHGNLLIETRSSTLRMEKPLVYQDSESGRDVVPAEFRLTKRGVISFRIGAYDKKRPLIIDPVLGYSTYLGGSGSDTGTAIAVDSGGNVYVTGSTTSVNFPLASAFQSTIGSTSGFMDVYVSKLSASGSILLYSTYLGGTADDAGAGIAVDSNGNAYVTGYTTSTNYPTQFPIQTSQIQNGAPDAFVTKLTSSGSALVYSTYVGGTSSENGNGIAVDSGGNAYITGFTSSGNFPVTVGAFRTTSGNFMDAFIVKINASGSAFTYATYFGGTNAQNRGNAIAVDSGGNAYVTGETSATNFPTTLSGFQRTFQGGSFSSQGDGFVTKMNPTGTALVYSTYLGGSDDESPKNIAIDSAGNAYITGIVISTNYPTLGAIQSTHATGAFLDAFVTKLNATGSGLVYSTYLGGTGTDYGWGIAVDGSGNAVVGGSTTSTNFPVAGAIQQSNRGGNDAWVAKLNAAGSAFLYSTYLGGTGADTGSDVGVDASGNAYMVGSTDSSTTFPTQSAFQSTNRGGLDAFIAKVVDFSSTKGDANGDGNLTVADIFYLVNNLFASGPAPVASGDVNGDGQVTVSDVFYLVNHLFAGGPGPV